MFVLVFFCPLSNWVRVVVLREILSFVAVLCGVRVVVFVVFISVRADSSFPKWCSAEVVRMTRFRLVREMRCGRSDLFRVYCLSTCIRPFVWLRAMRAGALPLIRQRGLYSFMVPSSLLSYILSRSQFSRV